MEKNRNEILKVEHLSVFFRQHDRGLKTRMVHGVEDLNLTIHEGEIAAVVGSSGSGKSLLAHAVMGILPYNAFMDGTIRYDGEILDKKRLKALRGHELVLVPQSVSYLDPLMKVGKQVTKGSRKLETVLKMRQVFSRYGLEPGTEEKYPFELSGGMRQRVMIALAFSCAPELIVADEPTTALDVTVQLQVLRLLKHKARASGTSVLFISHDMAVVSQLCDRMYVMYAGSVIESGATQTLIHHPVHPYSIGLLQCAPENGQPRDVLPAIPGTVPNLSQLPRGCAFRERCFAAGAKCGETPRLMPHGAEGQQAACWYPQQGAHHV